MKQFKLYFVLIFSFFLIPFCVNAEINSFPTLSLTDDEIISLINDITNFNSNLDSILLSNNSVTLVKLVSYDINSNSFEGYHCGSGDIISGTFRPFLNKDCTSIYVFSDRSLFWSKSDIVLGNLSDSFLFADSILDHNYYPFGNLNYLYTTASKYESMFYRHFGYYDTSSIDKDSPIISLFGNNDITIEINSIWNDPGYSCSDNIDTSCSVNVSSDLNISSLGDYTISYNATDSSGNVADTVYRHIHVVDTISPDISLIGDSVIHISLDSEYEELGVNVSDNSKEDIIPVIDSSSLDVSSAGSYTITYYACDSSDNCSCLKRIVKVQSVVPLDFSGNQYLLFDFSDIQDLFPKINFSGLSNSDEFIIVILFNIFFLIFIFLIIWIILKSVYKAISIIWG